jgi:hypothetical protein
MLGPVGLSTTSNRVRYLNGNYTWSRFNQANTSTRAPAGDCSPGADPTYCFRFDTAVTTEPSTAGAYVVSWDVTKPIVNPGRAAAQAQSRTAAQQAETDVLERQAQQFVDTHFRSAR